MGLVHLPYAKRAFVPNLAFLLIVICGTAGMLYIAKADLVWSAVLICVELVALIVLGISPLTTEHCVINGTLSLRQGWYFKADIPLEQIKSASRIDKGPRRVGVFFKIREATLYVTTRRNDLIEIRLESERKFGWALGKRASTIVFDAEDVPRAIKALETD